MTARRVVIALCLALVMVNSGCWDRREIESLAFVAAVGLDKAEDGQIEVSVQLINPSALGQTSEGNAGSSLSVWVVSFRGRDVMEAVRGIVTLTGKRLHWAHNLLVVFGEELARSGIKPYVDWFRREYEPPLRAWVLTTPGTAKEIIAARHPMVQIPAQVIARMVEVQASVGAAPQVDLLQLVQSLRGSTGQVTGAIRVIPSNLPKSSPSSENLQLFAAAVYGGGRLLGYLTPIETRGLLWLTPTPVRPIVVLPQGKENEREIAVEIVRFHARMIPRVNDSSQARIQVEIQVAGNVGEVTSNQEVDSESILRRLEERTAAVIRYQAERALDAAQNRYRVDIFGVSDVLRKREPEYWTSVEDRWNDAFTALHFDLNVNAKIRLTGLITNPLP